MHDLRKKALLESGKTLSRKARSKPDSVVQSANTSPIGSRPMSRPASKANSRAGSRYASEDEAYNESDDVLTISTLSLGSDDSLEDQQQTKDWPDRLHDRINDLQERKHTSVHGRETVLAAYLHLLRYHYGKREVEKSYSDILPALLKSIKSGSSAHERSLALKALTITILTFPSDTVFGGIASTIKTVCQDDENDEVKVDAIYALTVAALLGGGSPQDWEEATRFFLGIIETDGRSVGSEDSAQIVVAALEAWAFLASNLDQVIDQSQQALEAFIEQLESTDAEVQAAAGSNIAFLFEAARTYNEPGSEDSEEEDDEDEDIPREPYNLHCDLNKLISQMTDIARRSSKSISKKDKRQLKSRFASVVTSLELGKGPGYTTSGRPTMNPHTGGRRLDTDGDIQAFGYRERLRVNDNVIVIDSWAISARVDFARQVLGGGFGEHFESNPAVQDIMSEATLQNVGRGSASKADAVDTATSPESVKSEHESEGQTSPLSGKAARKQRKEQQQRAGRKPPKSERNKVGL